LTSVDKHKLREEIMGVRVQRSEYIKKYYFIFSHASFLIPPVSEYTREDFLLSGVCWDQE